MRYLLQTLRSYPTSHMEQESNQVAHCAQHSSDPFVWHEECPSVIQRVLLDHRCIPFWHSCFPCLLFSLSLSLSLSLIIFTMNCLILKLPNLLFICYPGHLTKMNCIIPFKYVSLGSVLPILQMVFCQIVSNSWIDLSLILFLTSLMSQNFLSISSSSILYLGAHHFVP